MIIKAPKGTDDITAQDSYIWQFMENKAQNLFENSNYKEVRTPIFESTELFHRGVGDSTDIVNKEMYTFVQKERSLTLRPENTAGAVRAYIENGMHRLPSPLKLWYKGPMFRYERPQGGRKRQFHQVGVELFGIQEAIADAEVIKLAMEYLDELNIPELSLEINNIGCPECRNDFRDKIRNAVQPGLEMFCADCKVRYDKNPLRMLDCKNDTCKELLDTDELKETINSDYICEECSTHFDNLKKYLNILNIKYTINKKLVRGLDYYTKTVFEITSNNLGAQNAVCGGGRYDGLVEMLGGKHTPAVGWAMGMERLMAIMPTPEPNKIKAFVVSNNTYKALELAFKLRSKGISTDFDLLNRKFVKQLDKASKLNADYAVLLGEDEINSGTVTVKNLKTSEQHTLSQDKIFDIIEY